MVENYTTCNDIVQYNSIISSEFPSYGFYPSILSRPLINGTWPMELPNIRDVSGIVLHTQDNLNILDNGAFPELLNIENFYVSKNISNIVVVCWNHNLSIAYEGPLNVVEFPTHSFEFVQNFKNRYNEWEHVSNDTHNNNFMCLNGFPRKHRILVHTYLTEIFPNNNYVTLGSSPSSNDKTISYKNYNFDNTQNFINLVNIYKNSNINIVTETMYYERYGIITEKTLQSFGAMQLPIIIGYKGIVSDLRSFGFDMFDDIIDHSYDKLSNDVRWKQAIVLNMDVLKNGINYDKLLDRLKSNQRYLLNEYNNFIVRKFRKQVNELPLKRNENHYKV